jgi:hypothetical protein
VIAQQRLRTQRLAGPGFATPADVVRWFGAVQAQDYAGALWALGLRTKGATEASVERALVDRSIVRTWPLRGTLHFAAAADVRWMMNVFGAQTIARTARRFRQFDLDDRIFKRCTAVTIKALEGGRQLSRPRLYAVFEKAGVATGGMRGLHIAWKLAHDGLICFGAREGRQQTFALLEEWVPRAKTLSRDEAMAELARRYFTSHAPATLRDFTWWSGLLAADARRAVEAAGRTVAPRTLAPRTTAPRTSSRRTSHRPHVVLLPSYDEYTVAYLDRSAALDPRHAAATRNGLSPIVVIDGRIAGTWSPTETRAEMKVSLRLFRALTPPERRGLAAAVERYRAFKRPI